MRLVIAASIFFACWLLLSGEWGHEWLIWTGGIVSVAAAGFGVAKGLTDEEGFPIELLPRAVLYWPWLCGQIFRSALNVARIALSPGPPVSPRMVEVAARQRTAAGLAVYANSITLTPGTISIEVSESERKIWVHALTAENAEGMADDEMNRRVARMEGGR